MMLFIKTLTGKTIKLEVESHETILDMKKKIAIKENIPVVEQRLIFAGKEMDNKKKIEFYELQKHNGPHLVQRQLVPPPPQTKNKNQAPKKSELKPREKKGNSLQLFVRTLSGNTVTVDIYTDDTIAHVKEEVARKTDLTTEQIRLIFAGKGLDDDKKVSDYNMQKESTLHLVQKPDQGIEKKQKPQEEKKNTKLMWRVGNFNPIAGDEEIEFLECCDTIEGAFQAYANRQLKNIKDKRQDTRASIQAVEIDLDELKEVDHRRVSKVYQNVQGATAYVPKDGCGQFVDFKVLAFFNEGSATFMDVDVEPDSPQTRVSLNDQLFRWANTLNQPISFFEPSAPYLEEDPYASSAPMLEIEDNNDILVDQNPKEKLKNLLGDSRGGDANTHKNDMFNQNVLNRYLLNNQKMVAVDKLNALEELFNTILANRNNLYTHTNTDKQDKELTATQKRHIGLLKSAYVVIVEKNSQNPNVRQIASTIRNPEGLVDYNKNYGGKQGFFKARITSTRCQVDQILNLNAKNYARAKYFSLK